MGPIIKKGCATWQPFGHLRIKISHERSAERLCREVVTIAVTIARQIRKRLKLHSFSQPPVYPGRVALPFEQSGGQGPSILESAMVSRDRVRRGQL